MSDLPASEVKGVGRALHGPAIDGRRRFDCGSSPRRRARDHRRLGAAIYFFGGFYNVVESADNPAIVDWALASASGASVVAHGTETPPANLDDTETVKAGARIYSTIGCVNCHGGPPDANWAKWSEGLKPVPADLKVMAKERTASQLFWAIKNGIKFTGMPSFGLAGSPDKDLWSIVAFVKKSPSVSDDEYKAWTASP